MLPCCMLQLPSRLHYACPPCCNILSLPTPGFRESQRLDRIVSLLPPKLSLILPFPTELLVMVARLLVRECSVVTTQEQARAAWTPGISRSVTIELSHNVYARYCRIDGTRYVQTLQNTTPEPSTRGEWQLLFNARKGAVSRISVMEDHLGIRLIKFRRVPDSLATPPSLDTSRGWWRDVEIRAAGGSSTLQGRTDVRQRELHVYIYIKEA